MDNLYRRAINFDLKLEELEKHYPKQNIRTAYDDVRKFFEANGFVHRQHSGYVSLEPLYDHEVIKLTQKLALELPWVFMCAPTIDLTDIGKIYDIKQVAEQLKTSQNITLSEYQKSPLALIVSTANQKAEQYSSSHKQNSHYKNKEEIIK